MDRRRYKKSAVDSSEAPAPSNTGTYALPASPIREKEEGEAEEIDVGEEIDSFLEQDGPR